MNHRPIKASNHFLAVDGVINTGVNGISTLYLSRSLNLLDTLPNIPELNAVVMIVASNGTMYSLVDTGTNGNVCQRTFKSGYHTEIPGIRNNE